MPRGLHLSADSDHSGPDHESAPSVEVELQSSPSTVLSQSNPTTRKPKFDNTVIIPVTVDVKGNLKPSFDCSQRCTYYFHQSSDAEGITWKKVTTPTKTFYWGEFKKYITHEGFDESVVKKAWNRKAARRYHDWMSGMSKEDETPVKGVEQKTWDAWRVYWNTDEYKKKSERASNNRHRNGKGMVNHTNGSQTFEVRYEKMNNEGITPDPATFHKLTHTRKVNNELVFCDEYAAQVNGDYLKREQQALLEVQAEAEASGSTVPTELPLTEKTALFKEAAGGEKKGAVYGSGSAAMKFYSLKSGVSTSVGCLSGSTVEVVRLREEVQELKDTMARMNEERKEASRETKKLIKKMMKKMLKKRKKRTKLCN